MAYASDSSVALEKPASLDYITSPASVSTGKMTGRSFYFY
jgi:hypothetical protein